MVRFRLGCFFFSKELDQKHFFIYLEKCHINVLKTLFIGVGASKPMTIITLAGCRQRRFVKVCRGLTANAMQPRREDDESGSCWNTQLLLLLLLRGGRFQSDLWKNGDARRSGPCLNLWERRLLEKLGEFSGKRRRKEKRSSCFFFFFRSRALRTSLDERHPECSCWGRPWVALHADTCGPRLGER